MNCLRVRNEIKAYIDGELGWLMRRRVSRHIACCPKCREEMTAMAELTNDLKNVPQAHAPSGLRQAVMGKMELRAGKGARRRWPYQMNPAAAVLLVAGVLISGAAVMPTLMRARCSAGRSEPPAFLNSSPQTASAKGATAPRFADGVAARPMRVSVAAPQPAPVAPAAQPLIIKTADVSIRVKEFDTAYNQAVSIAKSTGGYVTDSSAQSDGASPTSGTLTMRIPVDAFERTLERLGRLGKTTAKSISGEDVTGEVVDLEARLRNKRAEERQYLEIMNRAKRVPDIVTVTNELSRVRGEIEESQGRMKYLKSSVAMSTINLTLGENEKPKPVKSSIRNTWDGAIGALAGAGNRLLALGIWLVVFSPVWALALGGWLYARKRWWNERGGETCSGEPAR